MANENQKLNDKDLEKVSGGWEWQNEKYQTWLNGYNVKCPYCGNEQKEVVERKAASPSEVLFRCNNCRKDFFLRWDRLYNKVKVITQ